jgi:hypothetical protein
MGNPLFVNNSIVVDAILHYTRRFVQLHLCTVRKTWAISFIDNKRLQLKYLAVTVLGL